MLKRQALAMVVVGGLLVSSQTARADIPVVELVGAVHAVSAGYVVAGLERAEAIGAPLVIVRLDTPGGFDTAMRQIIEKILSCRTPVAVFVGPAGARAASAGFLITIVADVAAMAPGTNIGAAHPVLVGGQMDEVMSKKVTSDAAAYIRSKAARRGRNVEMAEQAVKESKSFTDKEALDLKLIDLVVKDIPELVTALDGREITRFDGAKVTLHLKGQRVVSVEMSWREAILAVIARPEIMFLLLIVGLVGLGTEITHPGLLFPGIIGSLSLILFLFASQIIPVNWAGVLLILLAIGLFAAEVKVASYGLLTVGGLVAMVLGGMMLVQAPIPEMRVPLAAILPAALAVAGWVLAIVTLVLRAQRRKVTTGAEGLVGERAVAATDLSPAGWVQVRGERWHAEAEGPVGLGETVTITAVDGLTLRVRKGA